MSKDREERLEYSPPLLLQVQWKARLRSQLPQTIISGFLWGHRAPCTYGLSRGLSIQRSRGDLARPEPQPPLYNTMETVQWHYKHSAEVPLHFGYVFKPKGEYWMETNHSIQNFIQIKSVLLTILDEFRGSTLVTLVGNRYGNVYKMMSNSDPVHNL